MKSILILICSVFALNAHAASFCNAGGADGPYCVSKDGKTAVYIHPRYYYTTGVSVNGFCNDGYIKIDGKELNGALDGQGLPDDQAALTMVQSVTSFNGITVTSPRDNGKLLEVNTAISFLLSDAGMKSLNDPKINSGHVLLMKDQKTAYMYLFSDDVLDTVVSLSCSGQ